MPAAWTTIKSALRRGHPPPIDPARARAKAERIEPSPENFRVLRLDVVANGLESCVHHFRAAASDEEGELRLDVGNVNFGGHKVSADGSVVVEAVTLAGLVARGVIEPAAVGLVWIDAQGHEPAVLAGASRLIEAGVPAVVANRQAKADVGPEDPLPWVAPSELRERVLAELRSNYTHTVELRKNSKQGRKVHAIDRIDTLVDSFRHCQDLLLVRRG
jgi:FkbM family methyltransferase